MTIETIPHPLEVGPPPFKDIQRWTSQVRTLKSQAYQVLQAQDNLSLQDLRTLYQNTLALSLEMSVLLQTLPQHADDSYVLAQGQDLMIQLKQKELESSSTQDSNVLNTFLSLPQLPSERLTHTWTQIHTLIATGMTALGSLAHQCLFLLQFRGQRPPSTLELIPSTPMSQRFAFWAESVTDLATQQLKSLQAMLLHTPDEQLASQAWNTALQIQSHTSLHAARFGRWMSLDRSSQKESEFEQDCQSAVQGAQALEWLGLAHTLAFQLSSVQKGVMDKTWLDDLRHEASTLPFASARPEGKYVKAPQVDDQPEDTLVCLKGVVHAITFEPDPAHPKVSTFIEFGEGKRGTRVKVRAHMFDMTYYELKQGAPITLTGHVKHQVSWGDSHGVGVELDRLSLNTFATLSWQDAITKRLKNEFTLFPQGLNASWAPPVRM